MVSGSLTVGLCPASTATLARIALTAVAPSSRVVNVTKRRTNARRRPVVLLGAGQHRMKMAVLPARVRMTRFGSYRERAGQRRT